MRARNMILGALLVFLACDDDPVAPPTGPTADFDVTPETGWTDSAYQVDATRSTAGDGTANLSVRWDWEDDGIWDTEWSQTMTATHEYETLGQRTIRLVVGDAWGQYAQATRRVHVVQFTTPEDVVDALSWAYAHRDVGLFDFILANDAERNAEYLFLLSALTDLGETQWGFAEEARIHQRMFEPENPPPGDSPVAPELWLEGMTITLTKQQLFTERPEMYTTWDPPGPLDPSIWRATGARYQTYVFFDMVGTDYKVEGEAYFVVTEDLTQTGRFYLFIWEDIGVPAVKNAAIESSSWSNVKALYR